MAYIHGKNTIVKWGATDLSAFTESTDFNDGVSAEKVTTYGATRTRESYAGSLGDGKITCKGTADDGVSGPEAILAPLMDAAAAVSFTFQPKGAGTGKPQKIVDVIITAFNTSHPVGGYVKWTCEMQMSGAINRAAQS